ncbi:MAG: GGDEF domain-containing protein [Lachnospiraceae bacterium]|nr:GGDEF domain-containing protein [Lachnospiraceae bacterium]
MGRRKNIALFVAMIENEFSYAICEGALLAAEEIDANLFIFPAGIIDAEYDDVEANCYRYQYNTLYSCAQCKEIDIVIMEYGSLASYLNDERKRSFLEGLGNVPIILLAGQEDGYSSICVDNCIGLQAAIEHLIQQKNCRKIGFVSGPIDTSQDARERLDVFKNTMVQNDLPVEEDRIVYGNFSEFSKEIVEDLLIRHPDTEAIVFANDHMAIGGYQAMRKLGLEPGKDILVTGFDDSPTAKVLEPNLTTVRVDAKELSYRAVLAAPDVLNGKEVHQMIQSRLVIRESSVLERTGGLDVCRLHDVEVENDSAIEQYVNVLYDKYFGLYFNENDSMKVRNILERYVRYYIHIIDADGVLCVDVSVFLEQHKQLGALYLDGYLGLDQYFSIIRSLYDYVNQSICDTSDQLRLAQMHITAVRLMTNTVERYNQAYEEKNKDFDIVLARVTRDMLQFSKEEKKRYESVVSKLQRVNFPSGYIYNYGGGIVHTADMKWKLPETLYVKAYYDGDDVHLYKGKEKRVKSSGLWLSQLLANDRRYSVLVLPLFSAEEQYGLLALEVEVGHLHYASQLACQVSVSLEVLEIIARQNAIKKELEQTLAKTEANNRVLDELSRSDQLTGVLNRRGFLDTVKQYVEDERNYGKKAIAVYADMDNLKVINDEFGHDEGDYSLKIIAKALTESLRQSDVVARMGGDEFAAFAVVSQENFPETIKKRIHTVLSEMDAVSGKPYHVEMSVGTAEFVIDETLNLEHILTQADVDLYAEKKNKKKKVYK